MKGFTVIRIFFILQLFSIVVPAQQVNQKLVNNQNGEEILIGYCNRAAFLEGQYREWFLDEYSYAGHSRQLPLLDSIAPMLDSVLITIVLGTWCSDSKEQFPRFLSLLDYMKFNENNLTIICVDRSKKTISENIDSLHIVLVPTMIFYRGGNEIGRITETPVETLESDLYRMFAWKKAIKN